MTRHGFALLALAIIAIASWAYNVNYNTRDRLERIADLRHQIAVEREALQVLRVEWAYLNNPDRLARLVRAHNDRLALVAMTPEVLSHAAAVPFPERQDLPRGFAAEPRPPADAAPDHPALAEALASVVVDGRRYPVPPVRPASWRRQ